MTVIAMRSSLPSALDRWSVSSTGEPGTSVDGRVTCESSGAAVSWGVDGSMGVPTPSSAAMPFGRLTSDSESDDMAGRAGELY